MAEDLSTRIADRLVELAYALDDARLPMPTRVAYVKRELALAAQELLNAHGVNACPEMRSAEQLEDGFPRWDDQGRRIAAGVLAVDAGQAFAEKLARFERLSHRQGELWERCQGKGWPDAESDEFHRLRDELLPALRTDLRALRADGVDVPAPARWCPECRSAGVVGIEQDVCPTCDGTGKIASGVAPSDGGQRNG